MPYNPNDPNYQTKSSRVLSFNDFEKNIGKEEEELKKVKRSYVNNDTENNQTIGNPKFKYNKVTHKIDSLSKAEVEDDLEALEDMEINDKEHKYKIEENHFTYGMKSFDGHEEILTRLVDSSDEKLKEVIQEIIDSNLIEIGNGLPFRSCIRQERFDLAKLLVDNGANPKFRSNMCLKWACEWGKDKALNFLLDNCTLTNKELKDLLYWAETSSKITEGQRGITIGILNNNANHNENYKIVESIEGDNQELINKILKSSGEDLGDLIHKVIDLNLINIDNGAPLRACLKHERLDLAKLLIEKGADPKFRRNMCLKWACSHAKDKVLIFLLDHCTLTNVEKEDLINWTKTSDAELGGPNIDEQKDRIIGILNSKINHNESYKITESLGTKLEAEGTFRIDRKEDGGEALIGESFNFNTPNSDEENGMFVIIQSWDENLAHTDIKNLVGKQVKITIEVV